MTGDGSHEGHAHGEVHDGGAHPARTPHHHEHRGGFRGWVRSVFTPHSHDAADAVDLALRDSDEGMRALKISLVGLALTAAFQVVIVLVSGSVALLADTVHNFSDALTAIPLGFAFWLARRPATKRYTFGFGRAEDLAGIFIVAMIALSALVAGWEAVGRLIDPVEVRNVGWVAVAGIVGFAGNEAVAAYRIRVGRRIGSAALVADGLHARTDGLTSLAVVGGAIGVALGVPLADPLIGLAIAVAIVFVLKSAARDIFRRLMDSVDPALVADVEGVLAGVPGVEDVDGVRIRWIGHQLRAEAEIVSDCDLTLARAHAIAEEAHHRLLHQVPRLAEAIIHSNPCDHDGRAHHEATDHHFGRPPAPEGSAGRQGERATSSASRPPPARRDPGPERRALSL